ncbi:MAG: hypothetical protein K0R15_2328 [Clostridiales bacterium]|jgi:CRISPR-associated protein Csh1|nr:hypothetical protein [Clostridiales bacterium]
MILDMLESYQAIGKGDNLALASYKLKEGLYIRLFENGDHQFLKVDKNTDQSSMEYTWFRNADFRSILVDMNKPVDPKKQIHSNNMYSIFFKSPKPEDENNSETEIIVGIDRFFSTLKNQGGSSLLVPYELDKPDMDLMNKWENRFIEFVSTAYQLIKEVKLKPVTYVKLFADVSQEKYITEYLRYMIPKIFNSNTYNKEVDGETYGLSNSNMGLNAKKPFLEHKTTNFGVPFRITTEQALNISEMFLWFQNQYDAEGKSIVAGYLECEDHEGYTLKRGVKNKSDAHIIHIEKGKYAMIDDYDFVPGIQTTVDFNLHNYLSSEGFESKKITDLKTLEELFDKMLFKGQMRMNYFTTDTIKPKEWFTGNQIELLLLSRNAVYTYFKKGDITAMRILFDNISTTMIKLMFVNSSKLPIEALNMRFSMLDYLKIEGKEGMGEMVKDIHKKLLNDLIIKKVERLDCQNDETYYYLVGQLANFLLSKSKAQKTTYRLAYDLINARNSRRFKLIFDQLFLKYGYDIELNPNGRFDKMFAAVNGYKPQENISEHSDSFMAGLASPCLIYTKAINKEEE